MNDHAVRLTFPEGTQSLFWFFLNFLSCQIIMDSPVFLYAESLGASATGMGLIAGMTPMMGIFKSRLPPTLGDCRVGPRRRRPFLPCKW